MNIANSQQGHSGMGALLEKKGKSQRTIARELGISKTTLNNWIRQGKQLKLTPAQTKKLCEALDCSLDELVKMYETLPLD